MSTDYKSIIGKKFNRLTILEFIGINKFYRKIVKCQCDCGNICEVSLNNLKTNGTKQCKICRYNNIRNKKGEAGFNSLYLTYKYNALNRRLKFSLTKEEFKELTSSNCFYCSEKPFKVSLHSKNKYKTSTSFDHSSYIYNGIDRKDNNIGYELNNCVSCCYICNQAKHKLTIDEFYNWILKIYNNLKKENKI